jgi:hypothetical protein
MSNYAQILHALKRPGIDVISWDTRVVDIDWVVRASMRV